VLIKQHFGSPFVVSLLCRDMAAGAHGTIPAPFAWRCGAPQLWPLAISRAARAGWAGGNDSYADYQKAWASYDTWAEFGTSNTLDCPPASGNPAGRPR
jgi:hypothetical protein